MEKIDMSASEEQRLPVAEVFRKGLAHFQDQSRWARGYYQYDKDGNKCKWAEGYSFCALGALVFYGNGHCHESMCCLQRVSEHLYGECMQKINDDDLDGYNKVIKAYEFAIQLWDGREPTEEELGMPVATLLERRNG